MINSDKSSVNFTQRFIGDINACYHYNYHAGSCENLNAKNGKILFLGDSFDMITEPFLSLYIHQIDFCVLRDHYIEDIDNYIKQNNYDTVIICYAPFMIGAHDNRDSANYKMFSFNKYLG